MNNLPANQSVFKRVNPSTILTYLLCTIVAVTVTAACSLVMALGVGMGSTQLDPIPSGANIAWAISGLAFIPCTIHLIALSAVHKPILARALGVAVITVGTLSTVGWFISTDWVFPESPLATAVVFAPIAIGLVAGSIMIARANRWKTVVQTSKV